MPIDERQPVLILGAGVSGLTLAQACRKENIPFRIFERDTSAEFRPAGWALTLNWSLPVLRSLLPKDVLERLPEAYVNKEAQAAGEKGHFAFYDLSTGEVKWTVPPADRIRVSRERFRLLLLSNLDVEWSKAATDIVKISTGGIEVRFTDGTSAAGSIALGCDGAHSAIRRHLHPSGSQNERLPIRLMGAKAVFPEAHVASLRKLDPYFFQGSDPRTDVYTYFSFIDAPSDRHELRQTSDGQSARSYVCQIMISWPYRSGFWGRAAPTDVPTTPSEQLTWLRTATDTWTEPFRSIIRNLPDGAEIKPVVLDDWVPPPRSLTGLDGHVLLVGDAAHAMVMYRGEGANHAIVDTAMLLEKVLKPLHRVDSNEDFAVKLQTAAENYESEVVERTRAAVLASRQACMDAHDFSSLTDDSPLVKKRAMRLDLPQTLET